MRKQRPKITGSDAAYTSDFSTRLPTNMPDESDKQPVAVAPPPTQIPEAKTTPPKQTATKPKVQRTKRPKATEGKPAQVRPKPAKITAGQGPKREIGLSAAVKLEHLPKLEAFEKHSVSVKNAISLAGRRAIERFEPKPEFIEKSDAERLPMRQGYHTTKRVDVALLDNLRDKHDPLRLSSDSAMLRGQFEPLFWQCLDEVIKELNGRFA